MNYVGTTVEYTGSAPEIDTGGKDNLAFSTGWHHFVGGASTGQYGVAGMVSERMLVNVTCKKAWMFFDDEIVAMATDINAVNAGITNSVVSTLTQIVKSGPITAKDSNNEYYVIDSGDRVINNPSWVHHDSTGYVLLDGFSNLRIKSGDGAGETLDVFTAYTDHGIQPENLNYAYIIKPSSARASEIDDYVTEMPITIIRNDKNAQGAFQAKLNMSAFVMYEPGSISLPTGTK